ncbi:MAG: DNA (cytosine-5-)-methyltransferase [Vicinamibacterales bacterium]
MIYDHYAAPLSELDQQMVQAVPAGGNWRNIPTHIPSRRLEQIRRSAALGEGSRSTYYGRLLWDRPAYTISTYFNRPGNGCFIHPSSDRLITIREAARLQSFPDSYAFRGPLRKRCSLVGNAVPPLLAFQIASFLPKGPFVDLFAGAGGLSLGFEWAGHEPVAALDHDADAVATIAANREAFSGALQADLSTATGSGEALGKVRALLGQRQVVGLVGGPPCQGFSTAGSCLADDPRNRLVSVMLDWAKELQPAFVVLENVPALMWRRHKGVLAAIHDEFERLGYGTASVILHAEGYGVPQLRRRLIVLAFRFNSPPVAWPKAGFRVLEPSFPRHQPGASEASSPLSPLTVADAISDLPIKPIDRLEDASDYESLPKTNYQRWARGLIDVHEWIPTTTAVPVEQSGAPTLPLN